MAESCNFNCSAPQVPYLPDSDISGAGVVVNYVATAALAVLIIFVYYVTIHDPSIDPFNTTRGGALSDRHNPLDDLLLRCLRSGPAYISKHVLGSRQILSPRAWSQLERVLIKVKSIHSGHTSHICLLLMSDLQIVTGFAILLSGFTQFQCGLAALNWRIILDLAWFSCLTHLSCLTMLRRHLYTHTFERAWRLFAMGVLAVLLAVGLLLTANPKWLLLTEDTRATPAVCILGCYLKPGPNKKWVEIIPEEELWNSLEWFWTPIISAIFIVVAFFSRVVRLHMALSVGVNRATQRLNGQMQRLLWVLFRVLCTEGDIYSLKRSLGYRPVFAIVMVLRFVLVSWASFAVEVSWVLTAFLWGTWRLIKDLSPDQNMEALDFSKQAWTFGQIVSVFALAAPLISIVGILEESEFVTS
ncbi:hypothetical protein N7494_010492 [Penicillium frequentans]|uniref:Uncharacterized protein n=1 Tax=Penicillium frequentans TaxID=3151616 RepID=A0AAD6CHT5_9EURO|nr:hypothetical protein N7494_010492 [Penicillium glabrum]